MSSDDKESITENFEAKERNILKIILDPVKENGAYTRVHKMRDTIRERRIAFNGHSMKMSPVSLTTRDFVYFLHKKFKGPFSMEMEKNPQEVGNTIENIRECDSLEKKPEAHRSFHERGT